MPKTIDKLKTYSELDNAINNLEEMKKIEQIENQILELRNEQDILRDLCESRNSELFKAKSDIEAEIKQDVLNTGKTIKGVSFICVFRKGAKSINAKKLEQEHPNIYNSMVEYGKDVAYIQRAK